MDTWTFDGNAGNRVIINAVTTSGSLNTAITLYPPGGGPAEAAAGYCGDQLDWQLQQSGLYTIVISDCSLSNSGNYNITLLKIPGAVSSPQDPNGGPIASGETLSGMIDVASDVDAFQFYGDVNDRVIINAVTTAGASNTAITLYPPGGGPAEAAAGYCGDQLDWQLQQSGLYTIVISDCSLSNSGTYNITLLKIPGGVSSPQDPDGGPIASGETLSGTTNVTSDMDAFKFYGEAGKRILVNVVTTSGSLNTTITLYPPGGGPAEAAAGYCGDQLDRQLQKTGLYTIVIGDCSLSQTGSYNITYLMIRTGPVSYPGDLDGGPITSGESLDGTINVASDLDAFQIYGDIGDRVIINAVTTSGSLNTAITLYPPDGGPAEAAAGYCGDQLDWQLLKTGLYTIVISDCTLANFGTYNVSLSKIPSTMRPGLYNPCPPVNGLTSGCCSTLRWDAVAGATGYDVYLRTDVTQPFTMIGNNIGSPSMAMPEVPNDQMCYWGVIAHTPTGYVTGTCWWFATFAGDVSRDGIIDFSDFAVLGSHWQQDEPTVDIAPKGGDGIINLLDLERLSDEWLLDTEPCY